MTTIEVSTIAIIICATIAITILLIGFLSTDLTNINEKELSFADTLTTIIKISNLESLELKLKEKFKDFKLLNYRIIHSELYGLSNKIIVLYEVKLLKDVEKFIK